MFESPLYLPQQITLSPTHPSAHSFTLAHHGDQGHNYTETVESINDLQGKILSWLKPMGAHERQEKLTFVNKDFVTIIRKMYKRRVTTQQQDFRLFEDGKNQSIEVDGRGSPSSACREKTHAQELLLRNVVVQHKEQPFDTISLTEETVQNIESLFELFSTVADGIAFELTEEDCGRLEDYDLERFFFEPEETPFYWRSIGTLLVSVFQQKLWVEYYKSRREILVKKAKDRDRKKINTFWRDLTTPKRMEVLEFNCPQLLLERIQELEEESSCRVKRMTYQHSLEIKQVKEHLKRVVGLNIPDFYERMRVATLEQAVVPETELNWAVLWKIKQFLIKRAQAEQEKMMETVFVKKGNLKKKKPQQAQKQVKAGAEKEEEKQKVSRVELQPEVSVQKEVVVINSTKVVESIEAADCQKPTTKSSKNLQQHHKKIKNKNRSQFPLFERRQDEVKEEVKKEIIKEPTEESKGQTSTGSPRVFEVDKQTKKRTVFHSDVDPTEQSSYQMLEQEPPCCEFRNYSQKEDSVSVDSQMTEESRDNKDITKENGKRSSKKTKTGKNRSGGNHNRLKNRMSLTLSGREECMPSSQGERKEERCSWPYKLSSECENTDEHMEPSPADFQKREREINYLFQKYLEKTVTQYTDSLKKRSLQSEYSRRVAFNRLLYLLSPFGTSLKVFGSWATGLALNDSDLDLAVGPFILNYFITSFGSMRDKVVSALYSLRSLVESKPWVKAGKLLDQAQVPVFKFSIDTSVAFEESSEHFYNILDSSSKKRIISIDLTVQEFECEEKTHVGLLVSGIMSEWKESFPSVLPICLLLKHILRQNKMGDAYTGGLSPYCVMIMLVAFLKHKGMTKENNCGKVLVEFLTFYTTQFNFRSIAIDLSEQSGNPFITKELSNITTFIEPVTRKVMKCTFSLLPQILTLMCSLLESLEFTRSSLLKFKDPRMPLPPLSSLENPLCLQFPL